MKAETIIIKSVQLRAHSFIAFTIGISRARRYLRRTNLNQSRGAQQILSEGMQKRFLTACQHYNGKTHQVVRTTTSLPFSTLGFSRDPFKLFIRVNLCVLVLSEQKN